MCSNRLLDRDAVMAVVERHRASAAEMAALPLDALDVPDLFTVLDTMETALPGAGGRTAGHQPHRGPSHPSPAQRMVFHAKDRGCTRPGCTAPGYLSEVHHIDEWANTHRTDIDNLTFVCGPDHRLLEEGWTVRKNADGITEWIPPPTSTSANPPPTATTTPNATSKPTRRKRTRSSSGPL